MKRRAIGVKKHKVSRKNKIIISVLLLLMISLSAFIFLEYTGKLNVFKDKVEDVKEKVVEPVKKKEETQPEVKKLKIIDESSNSRPIAVMINNHPTARLYHSGLQDAYIIYEIIVEGNLTRYMAVYKDADTGKIGSVRSSRHYFLDYAMENDAIYVHWGWSPMAQSDIRRYGIKNINGMAYEGTYFYRDKNINANIEHRGFTNMEMINKAISKLKYTSTSDKKTLLHYSIDEVDLSKLEGAQPANNVSIRYSKIVTSSYKYDSEAKVYKRFVNNVEHKDFVTKKQYTFKNIITYQVSNHTLSGDVKGRQDIDNVGSGTGYYISNGYAVPIKWSKSSRRAQTVYTYLDGREIDVNDGNTFIQIQPKNQSLSIN